MEVMEYTMEALIPKGYTWEDIQKAEFTWQTLENKRPSWQEWQELIPGGNWEDSLSVSAKEGETILLQVNGLNVPATKGVTFVIVYDPAAASWTESFPQEGIGLKVNSGRIPTTVSNENGELKLHFPIAPEDPWTGIITLLGFHAKKSGELTFALKGGTT